MPRERFKQSARVRGSGEDFLKDVAFEVFLKGCKGLQYVRLGEGIQCRRNGLSQETEEEGLIWIK